MILTIKNQTVEETDRYGYKTYREVESGLLVSVDIMYAALAIGRSEDFEQEISKLSEKCLYEILDYVSCKAHQWAEGVLICEREIDRRGLHLSSNEKRFDL